jgi:hypothetical protein
MACSLVEIHRRFGGTYCLHLQDRRDVKPETSKTQADICEVLVKLLIKPEAGGSVFVRNARKLLPDYAALSPRS